MSFLWEKLRETGNPGRDQKALGLNARSNRLPPTRARATADHGRLVRGNTEGLKAHLPCGFLFCYLLSDIKGKFSGVSQTPTDTLTRKAYKLCRKIPRRCSIGIPAEAAIRGRDGKGQGLWASDGAQRSHAHAGRGRAGRPVENPRVSSPLEPLLSGVGVGSS